MERQSASPESPATDHPEALWKLIMQLADPSDILKTLFDHSGRLPPTELKSMGDQSIFLLGCTVTIHQHLTITAPAERPTLAS